MMDWKKHKNISQILHSRKIYDNPRIYQRIIAEKLSKRKEPLYSRDLLAHFGCVNAVEISNNGQFLSSGGDDRRVLLWNVQKSLNDCGKPVAMKSQHQSNVFCLSIDNGISHIFSGGNDDQIIYHDISTGKALDVFSLQTPIYGISIDPCNDNIFASAAEDGQILVYDTRLNPENSDPYQLVNSKSPFHSVMFNPVDPRLIATGNSKEGTALWDIRVPTKPLKQYGRKGGCMSVRWNKIGTLILALRRRQTPVLYDFKDQKPIAQFTNENYYNSCTMKSCCFAGLNEEYILSGSDDFNVYMWKIDDAMKAADKTSNVHMILQGHRSIVNHVRFDSVNCIIASSGVEKLIKIWSPLPLPTSGDGSRKGTRKTFTRQEYVSMMASHGLHMSHDYSEQSTSEDPQIMAFFDSLIERDRNGDSSTDTDDDNSIHSNWDFFDTSEISSLSDDDSDRSVPEVVTNSRRICPRSPIENSEAVRLQSSRFLSYCESATSSSSSSSSYSSFSSSSSSSDSSFLTTTSSSNSTSSNSNLESNVKIGSDRESLKRTSMDALARLKRIRATLETGDSTSDASSAGISTRGGSGGISTDTVDSGVCVLSSPPSTKCKFLSFKKSNNRRYRKRRSSSCSSSSSSSTSSSDSFWN